MTVPPATFRDKTRAVCPFPFPTFHHSHMPSHLYLCFIGETNVSLSFDTASGLSQISASVVFHHNLPCIFDNSGLQHSSVALTIPTVDGAYTSQISLAVSYGLPSDIVLGLDWISPCRPLFLDDHPYISKPAPETIEALPPSHAWQPTDSPSIFFLSISPL